MKVNLLYGIFFLNISTVFSQIYVSPNGSNTTGNGLINKPYATLNYAINNLNGNDEIIINEGVYNIDNSIELTNTHNNLTISGCGEAILNGGLVLDNNLLPTSNPTTNIFSSYPNSNPLNLKSTVVNNVIVVDLQQLGLSEQDLGTMENHGYGIDNGEFDTPSVLWVDGQKMTLARFPNKNQVMSSDEMKMTSDWETIRPKMKGQISYHQILQKSAGSEGGIKFNLHSTLQNKVASWSHHKNTTKDKIWLDGVYNLSWEWEYNQVETITANGDITLKYEPNSPNFDIVNGKISRSKVSHFYFENVAEELDEEGEYFIDREAMKLYFYPPNDYQNKQITLSTLNSDLIKINDADGITVKNLTLQSGKKNAIRISNSENISLNNNTIRYFNQWAAKIDGKNNIVKSCEMYGLGGGGVELGINVGGDFNLNPENNKVEGCEIYSYAWDQKSQIPGVSLSGCGNIVKDSEIYDGTHFAVKLRKARLCKVENNKIHDLPTYHHFDGGAVYLGLGRKFHNRANEINNNFIYNVPTNGIYLDNYTNGNYANGNVLYNVGNSTFSKNYAAIYNHGGGQNTFENNVAIDCSVIIKTGSYIVKSGTPHVYFNDWFDTYHSSQFQNVKANFENANAVPSLSQTDTDWYMNALSNLPTEVSTFFGSYSPSDSNFNTDWDTYKDNWDKLGYEHTIAIDNPNDNLQQQWRNYFLLRYSKSTIKNNLGLYTDSVIYDAKNNKSSINNVGDGKVFWEFSPYIATDGTKYSNHIASSNEKLNVSETNNIFPSIVSNNSLNQSNISYSATSSNLNTDINKPISPGINLNLLDNLISCPTSSCAGLGLTQNGGGNKSGIKWALDNSCNNTFTGSLWATANSNTHDITIDSGTESGYLRLSFNVAHDGSTNTRGLQEATTVSTFNNNPDDILEITNNPNSDFNIEWIEHNWNTSNCSWSGNRRIDALIKYNGNQWNQELDLVLTFNKNDLLVSNVSELNYCAQTVNIKYTPKTNLICDFNLQTTNAVSSCNPYNSSGNTYSITIPFENGGSNQNISLSSDFGNLILTNDYNLEASGTITINNIPLNQSPTISGGTACDSNAIDFTFNSIPDCNYFVGTTSNKWHIASNWSKGVVPSDTSHAIIPDLVYADGKSNCLLPNGASTVGSMTVEANAEVNINKSSSLTVKNDLNVNPGGLLLVRSNGGSNGAGHGNLIVNGDASGNIRYDLYIEDYNKTSLITVPVTGLKFGEVASANNNLYQNPQNTAQKVFGPYVDAVYKAWDTNLNANEALNPGIGYRVASKAGNDRLIHFTGPITNTNVTLSFNTLNSDGWHLVGNPYTSGIDLKKFIDLNINNGNLDNLASAIYGWDADESDITGSKWTIITKNDQKFIPPGQGFFVKPSANKSLLFETSMQAVENGAGFIQKNVNTDIQSFYLTLSDGTSKAATKIYINNEASLGIDQGFDVIHKDNIESFGIFTTAADNSSNTPLAVQTIPETEIEKASIPLSINADNGINLTIRAEDININNDLELFLEDLSNGAWMNLKKEELKTTFKNITTNTRFLLHFENKSLSLGKQKYQPKIYKEGCELTIYDNDFKNSFISISDINGRIVFSKIFKNTYKKIINTENLNKGIYIINIQNSVNSFSSKIIL